MNAYLKIHLWIESFLHLFPYFFFHFYLSFLICIWRSRDESPLDFFCLSLSLTHLLFFSSLLFSSSFLSSMDVISLYYYDIFFILLSILHSIPFFIIISMWSFFFSLCHHYTAIFLLSIRPKMTKIFILFYFIQKSLLFLFALALRMKHTQRTTNRNSLMCEICFYIYAALISQQQI